MKHKITDEEWESIMEFFAIIFREPSRLDVFPDKVLLNPECAKELLNT